jgi:hypothetical protein
VLGLSTSVDHRCEGGESEVEIVSRGDFHFGDDTRHTSLYLGYRGSDLHATIPNASVWQAVVGPARIEAGTVSHAQAGAIKKFLGLFLQGCLSKLNIS